MDFVCDVARNWLKDLGKGAWKCSRQRSSNCEQSEKETDDPVGSAWRRK